MPLGDNDKYYTSKNALETRKEKQRQEKNTKLGNKVLLKMQKCKYRSKTKSGYYCSHKSNKGNKICRTLVENNKCPKKIGMK